MIIFTNANGTVLNVMPQRVYQGSNEANQIYLIAPFARTNIVEIAFKLPQSGILTEPYLMTYQAELTGLMTANGEILSGWMIDIPIEVTEFYGKATLQIYVKALKNKKTVTIATSGTTFEIERGVKPILPDTPSQDVYDQILGVVNGLQAEIENGLASALELVASANSNTTVKPYSLNSLVWFYEEKCLAQSLIDNNDKPLFNEDGSINTEYWRIFSQDANAIAEAVAKAVEQSNLAITIANEAVSTANSAKSLALQAINKPTTIVTVNGENQSTWNADLKADVTSLPTVIRIDGGEE